MPTTSGITKRFWRMKIFLNSYLSGGLLSKFLTYQSSFDRLRGGKDSGRSSLKHPVYKIIST